MGVIWWGTCPPPPPPTNVWQWGDRISDVLPHFLGWKTFTHFNIYSPFTVIFTCSHSLPIFLHVLTLYPYSDILSVYSIHRVRGNINQSHNDLQFYKNSGGMHLDLSSMASQLVAPNIFIIQWSPLLFPCK